MSHKKNYRKDKTCLNCRHVVAQKFCPNCGQENTDVRKTFFHLFIHFFEDLTHYENAFWRTMKNLLLKPAALTKEYLSGKRLSYLAPVRLYIFISFVTFFILSFFPSMVEPKIDKNFEWGNKVKNDSVYISEINKISKKNLLPADETKEISKVFFSMKTNFKQKRVNADVMDYKSIKQLDSLQKFGPKEKKAGALKYWLAKKLLYVMENNTNAEILDKGFSSAKNNIPKVLIIYMPFFAFFLWLFHGKKRWYYFDHGIFTLHYFSFLLLMFLIVAVINAGLNQLIEHWVVKTLKVILSTIGYVWSFYYFFPAHHRFYGETRWISFFKSYILFFINMFFILFLLTFFFVYTIINIH